MKASELRVKTNQQLEQQIKDNYEELFNLRFQQVTGRLTNTSRARLVRKEIARIKTILRERELGAEETQG